MVVHKHGNARTNRVGPFDADGRFFWLIQEISISRSLAPTITALNCFVYHSHWTLVGIMGRLRRSRTHHAQRDVHRAARTRVSLE